MGFCDATTYAHVNALKAQPQAFAIQPRFCPQPYSPTSLHSHPSCAQQAEEVFQLQQQHWRLADASWSLITLLQKAAATLASLSPQGPGLIRRLTPTPQGGSTKSPAALPLAGTAEQSGELVCMLDNARKGCCSPRSQYACFIPCMHASDCKDDCSMNASFIVCMLKIARKGCGSQLVVCMPHASC